MAAEQNWSYFNVLEALVAKLPPGTYRASVEAWAEALWGLREKFEDQHPELFAQIHFVKRFDRPPYSRQVSDFFVSQSFGGLKQALNPAYVHMVISEEALKELALRGETETLIRTYEGSLDEMAAALEKELKVI